MASIASSPATRRRRASSAGLAVEVLGDRLDDERALGQRARGRSIRTWRADLAAQAAADLVDAAARARRTPRSAPTARRRRAAAASRPGRSAIAPAAGDAQPFRPRGRGSICPLTATAVSRRTSSKDGMNVKRPAGPRGRHRRGRPHADRARPPGEGLLQGHPPERAARRRPTREVLERAGVDAGRGRGRHRRLRAAVRRAGPSTSRRNAWLQDGLADRDAGDDRRPPVRLGPAGRQLRRGADRLRRPRRRRSARGVEHMGHICRSPRA